MIDTHYEWELQDASGEWQAGGSGNDLETNIREGMRYLAQYSQDGPHKLIVTKHVTEIIQEVTNAQRHPTPVPVSERLPEPGDCDEEGRCWTYEGKHLPSYMAGPWVLREPPKMSDYFWRNVTYWLPANALPLPACTKSGDSNE